jgi:hypothetical protein
VVERLRPIRRRGLGEARPVALCGILQLSDVNRRMEEP